MIESSNFNGVSVSEAFDYDDEIRVSVGTDWCWIKRAEVRRLRDHLTAALGDGGTPAGPGVAAAARSVARRFAAIGGPTNDAVSQAFDAFARFLTTEA